MSENNELDSKAILNNFTAKNRLVDDNNVPIYKITTREKLQELLQDDKINTHVRTFITRQKNLLTNLTPEDIAEIMHFVATTKTQEDILMQLTFRQEYKELQNRLSKAGKDCLDNYQVTVPSEWLYITDYDNRFNLFSEKITISAAVKYHRQLGHILDSLAYDISVRDCELNIGNSADLFSALSATALLYNKIKSYNLSCAESLCIIGVVGVSECARRLLFMQGESSLESAMVVDTMMKDKTLDLSLGKSAIMQGGV